MLECFLVNGKHILLNDSVLIKIYDNHVRLSLILQREIKKGYYFGNEDKVKYTEIEMELLKKELFSSEIIIECLDFMLLNRLKLTEFCKKYGLSAQKFLMRLRNIGIEFDNNELETLQNHNITNII